MNKNLLLLLVAILILALISWFFQSGFFTVYDSCRESREINEQSFKGYIIEKKDSDPHSRNRQLCIKTDSLPDEVTLVLLHDMEINKSTGKSLFWEKVNVGDSVYKQAGSFYVSYKHEDSNWIRMRLGFELCQ